MTDLPTPETDANAECEQDNNSPFAPVREWVYASFARRLERERDEARAFNMRASRDASIYASMLHEKLESERALADRLGHSIKRLSNMSPLIYAHAMDDLTAWKEARK